MSEAEASAGKNTHFAFGHKVFAIGGCHFSSGARGEARFKLPMGDSLAAIAFPALRQEFGIDEDSADGKMLDTVEEGLKFVKIIHPDDSIPSELLDGTASWTVDDEHRVTAKNRLMVQLVTWLSGSEEIVRDPKQLELMAENSQSLGKLKSAFSQMAERIGAGEAGDKEVIARMDRLAHELSYVEGLWAHFMKIKAIRKKTEQARQLVAKDASIKDTLERVPLLLNPVIDDIEFLFDQLEAQSEITRSLENCDAQIEVIREARDSIHVATQPWDELVAKWEDEPAKKASDSLEKLAQETYQFLAQNYPQSQEWDLNY